MGILQGLWFVRKDYLYSFRTIKDSVTNGHLLNDDSNLSVTGKPSSVWLAELTVAKKVVAQRWKAPLDISDTHQLLSFVYISYLELSFGRVNATNMRHLPDV